MNETQWKELWNLKPDPVRNVSWQDGEGWFVSAHEAGDHVSVQFYWPRYSVKVKASPKTCELEPA